MQRKLAVVQTIEAVKTWVSTHHKPLPLLTQVLKARELEQSVLEQEFPHSLSNPRPGRLVNCVLYGSACSSRLGQQPPQHLRTASEQYHAITPITSCLPNRCRSPSAWLATASVFMHPPSCDPWGGRTRPRQDLGRFQMRSSWCPTPRGDPA